MEEKTKQDKKENNSDRQNFPTTANQWTKCDKRERTENTNSTKSRLTKQNELNTHRIASGALPAGTNRTKQSENTNKLFVTSFR